MGYTTSFKGQFNFNRQIDLDTYHLLNDLHEDTSEFDNTPSEYCQWVTDKHGRYLEWDENEKFYNYVEWLEYIIKYILEPKQLVLNGEVHYQGDDIEDKGKIIITDNKVKKLKAKVTVIYQEEWEEG